MTTRPTPQPAVGQSVATTLPAGDARTGHDLAGVHPATSTETPAPEVDKGPARPVTLTKIRKMQNTRTLSTGAKLVHERFIVQYFDYCWHELPVPFSDRAQAKRAAVRLKRGEAV